MEQLEIERLQSRDRELTRIEELRKQGCSICQRPFRFQEEYDAGVCAVCVIAVKNPAEALANHRDELVSRWMDNELADYKMVMDHCSQIYMHCSGGRISKPNTLPEAVIGEMENHWVKPEWYVICVDQCDNTFLGIEGPFDYKEDAEAQLAAEKERGATESELFYTGSGDGE